MSEDTPSAPSPDDAIDTEGTVTGSVQHGPAEDAEKKPTSTPPDGKDPRPKDTGWHLPTTQHGKKSETASWDMPDPWASCWNNNLSKTKYAVILVRDGGQKYRRYAERRVSCSSSSPVPDQAHWYATTSWENNQEYTKRWGPKLDFRLELYDNEKQREGDLIGEVACRCIYGAVPNDDAEPLTHGAMERIVAECQTMMTIHTAQEERHLREMGKLKEMLVDVVKVVPDVVKESVELARLGFTQATELHQLRDKTLSYVYTQREATLQTKHDAEKFKALAGLGAEGLRMLTGEVLPMVRDFMNEVKETPGYKESPDTLKEAAARFVETISYDQAQRIVANIGEEKFQAGHDRLRRAAAAETDQEAAPLIFEAIALVGGKSLLPLLTVEQKTILGMMASRAQQFAADGTRAES